MKYTTALSLAAVASASAFVPAQTGSARVETAIPALADRIFGMDLFKEKADQNNYGARSKKNLKVGTLTDKSYIPNGLSKAEYDSIRKGEQKKKDDNYAKNVKKAGVFIDYTDWYMKRGTDLNAAWKKSVTLGHEMAKTKYDWSGTADAKKFESTNTDSFVNGFFGAKKKAAPAAKKAAPKKTFKKLRNF